MTPSEDDPMMSELDRRELELQRLKIQQQIKELGDAAELLWEKALEAQWGTDTTERQQPTGVVVTGHEKVAFGGRGVLDRNFPARDTGRYPQVAGGHGHMPTIDEVELTGEELWLYQAAATDMDKAITYPTRARVSVFAWHHYVSLAHTLGIIEAWKPPTNSS